jgi:cholesterol transport system auxiliary component
MSACVSPTPAPQEFILMPKLDLNAVKVDNRVLKTIKIENSYSDTVFKSSNMYYVQNREKQFSFSKSKWAYPLNSMINENIIKMVRDLKLFKFVQSVKSKTKSEYTLESTINDFKQYFYNNDTKSYVKSSITFTLLNSNTHEILASKTFESKVDVDTLNAVGGVKALNNSLNDVLIDAALWLSEVSNDI